MKKIMFNDKYGLTQAVLDGRKTQTRRIITYPKTFKGKDVWGFYVYKRKTDGVVTEVCMFDENESSIDEGQMLPKYKVEEVVAVAQSYRDCGGVNKEGVPMWEIISQNVGGTNAGWDNKMFVRGDLMPHKIRITDVRVERLQDISDEDCLKEGLEWDAKAQKYYAGYMKETEKKYWLGSTPQEAFAHLINKVSRKDVWQANPFVLVYDFELVR